MRGAQHTFLHELLCFVTIPSFPAVMSRALSVQHHLNPNGFLGNAFPSPDEGCFLQNSPLPLIIALTFACSLLLFSNLFPNTSLVTRGEQKERRWFIRTKLGVELCSVLHFFLKQSRGNCQQSLLNQSIPSLPPQRYLHFSASHRSHCKEGGDFSVILSPKKVSGLAACKVANLILFS